MTKIIQGCSDASTNIVLYRSIPLQYFVAFKDTDEIRWQVELLYESIKLLGLSNQFLVSIKSPLKKHIYPNIIYCKDVENAHFQAIKSGFLKDPFVNLKPHSFLIKEVCTYEEMPLIYNGENKGIVNYKDGYLPYFDKDNVINSINFSFTLPLPFKIILGIPCLNQPNVVVLQTLVRSWVDSNLTRMTTLL